MVSKPPASLVCTTLEHTAHCPGRGTGTQKAQDGGLVAVDEDARQAVSAQNMGIAHGPAHPGQARADAIHVVSMHRPKHAFSSHAAIQS